VYAQQTVSGTVAEQAQRWIEIFNSGDYAAMEQFQGVTADGNPEARESLLRSYEMYLVTRGIDAESVEQTGNNKLTIKAKERLSGDGVNIILDTSGGVPRLDGMRLARTPDAESTGSKFSEAELLEDLDRQITHRSDADEFSGAVLVAKDGQTIFRKAWGLANKSSGALNRTDTKFNLASCGKMFTAVAVLQLAQAGKLSLDDTVGKVLPNYKNEDVRENVTVRQLLSHTSGMGDIFTDEFKQRRTEIRTVADWVSLFEAEPLKFEPGTRWAYSNAGFCLLGAIIEKVSGQNYYDYLDEHVFTPAGMINTGAFETDRPVDNLAIGYTRMGATTPKQLRDRIENTDLHSVKGSPAGGSYSTVEDMANFAAALLGHNLLNAEYTRLAMTQHFPDVRNADPYGLGFGVEDVNGHRVVGHGGGFPGISASFDMFPDDGYVVVVMSNYDMVARRFSMQMREWIVAQPNRAAVTKAD
jgi:CubicO group peptidase (beta-lactamase class C family)